MPPYETEGFEPPAPVVKAVVWGPSGAVRDVRLLIDTGADGSVIPLSVAKSVGAALQPSSSAVQTYSGDKVLCDQAEFTMEFHRIRVEGPFLVAESDMGILGRNVLNNLLLRLDGPGLVWEIGRSGAS